MLQIPLWKRILILLTCLCGLWLAMPNMFYGPVEQHNDAVKAIELGAATSENEELRALWPEWLPSGLVNLGLDLRGGAARPIGQSQNQAGSRPAMRLPEATSRVAL